MPTANMKSSISLRNLQAASERYRQIRDNKQLEADAADLDFSRGQQNFLVLREKMREESESERKRQKMNDGDNRDMKEEIHGNDNVVDFPKESEYDTVGAGGVTILDRLLFPC